MNAIDRDDTAQKIAEIREGLEKATPGPWEIADTTDGYVLLDADGRELAFCDSIGRADDARFIANAPEWLRFLLSEIDRLKEENERLKNGGWISVKDRLPNIGDTVLSIDRDRDQVVAVFDGSAFFDDHGMGAGIKHFTHWMPLPEPPREGELCTPSK